jgi:Tfp pilus assembly protein PilZ
MDNRKARRLKRRIQVRFWKQDDSIVKSGFTYNVSLTGMFVCTNSPFKPKTRITIEIGKEGGKLELQGVVRHAARVDPVLHKVKPSGMGVRLLKTEELMAAVLGLEDETSAGDEEQETLAGDEEQETLAGDEEQEQEQEKEEKLEEEEAIRTEAVEDQNAATIYTMNFVSPRELATTFERDLKFGGIFVPTLDLPEGDDVVIEFLFDWDDFTRVQIPALVVKRFDAAEGTAAGEKVTGIGVAFSDPEGAIMEFLDIVEALKRQQ